MVKPNPIDQKLQSVLYAMGVPLGKHGLDGARGADTDAAVNIGAAMIGKSVRPEDMRKALVDQLKDPKFLNWALIQLERMPENRETTIAMKTILVAVGHNPISMRDPETGMMTGKMNAATKAALANTRDGMPISIPGVPESAIQTARSEVFKRDSLNDTFQMAVVPPPNPQPSVHQPVAQPARDTRVAVASLDKPF